MDAYPQVRQPAGDGAPGQIGAAHAEPLAHQQLRQAAHADAADADEVVGGFISHIIGIMAGSARPTFIQ